MTGNMTVDVDCTWHSRNVSRHCLNVQTDGCGLSAKALWSDAKLIDFLKHFIFQVCVEWIRVVGI